MKGAIERDLYGAIPTTRWRLRIRTGQVLQQQHEPLHLRNPPLRSPRPSLERWPAQECPRQYARPWGEQESLEPNLRSDTALPRGSTCRVGWAAAVVKGVGTCLVVVEVVAAEPSLEVCL